MKKALTPGQAKLWLMFFDRMLNEPGQEAFYLMRLIAGLDGFWAKELPDPNLYRINITSRKADKCETEEEIRLSVEAEKAQWIAALGGRVTVKNA